MKVLNSFWFSPMGMVGVIGVVAALSGDGTGIKYYIGTASGLDKDADESYIAQHGARFPDDAGSMLFDGCRF